MTKRAVWVIVLAAGVGAGLEGVAEALQPFILRATYGDEFNPFGRAGRTVRFALDLLYGLSVLIFGLLNDRIGRRQIILFGLLVSCIGFLALPLATTTGQMLPVRAALSIGNAAIIATTIVLLHDYVKEGSRAKFAAVWVVASALGRPAFTIGTAFILQPFMTEDFTVGIGPYLVAWPLGSLLVMLLVLAWGSLGNAAYPRIRRTADMNHLVFLSLTAEGDLARWVSFAAHAVAAGGTAVAGGFFLFWAMQQGVIDDDNPGKLAASVSTLFGFSFAARLGWAPLAAFGGDRYNRLLFVAAAATFNALGFVLIAFMGNPQSLFSYLIAVVAGMGSVSLSIAALTLAGQRLPDSSRGAILGGYLFAGWLGSVVMLFIVRQTYDGSAQLAFITAAAANLLLAFIAVMVYRRSGEPFRLSFDQDESKQI